MKQAKEVVSKPQVQDNKAVSKPITGDEVVGRPQHDETEDAVGMPIYGNDQATVEKSPENEEIANLAKDDRKQSFALVAATPVTTRDSQWMDPAAETVINILDEGSGDLNNETTGTETKRSRVE